ncbi:MAG: GumC family protein [Planctomycetota bacterium]
MNDLERYEGQQIVQEVARFEGPAEPESGSTLNLIVPILRRWRIVLLIFFLICAMSIPAVWLLMKPTYAATAAIHVAPIIPSILFSDRDSEGVMPMYRNFMNTQAELIRSNQVLQRVVDDLADKRLMFFEEAGNPVTALREALINGDITVATYRYSELISVSMEDQNPAEAEKIVNAFVRAYMATEVSKEAQGGDHKLVVLESERKVLANKWQGQRETIRQMGEEYGSVTLTDRQNMMLGRVANIQAELTNIQTQKIALEAKVQLLEKAQEQGIELENLLKLRHEFTNADLTVQALTGNIAQLEQDLIAAEQTLAPTNPELKHKAELLQAMKVRLEEKRQEVAKDFDDLMSVELARSNEDQLDGAKVELEQIAKYEKRLQDMLNKEDAEAIEIGRKQLTIQDLQEQLGLTKELYDTVRRRIQMLEMERKRPGRISVAYYANVAPVRNKRLKYTAVLMFGGLGCGMFLAFLMGKADRSLYTPDDVVKRVGVRIIGTTTHADYVDRLKLPQQLADDYQTIRANLGLLDGGRIPRKLVVTSPGIREGKTTFAINLATSMAKAGCKVLLVDGDLRKPDIARLLNLPKGSRGLQEVLFGREFEDVVCSSMSSVCLEVLPADRRNSADAVELLAQPRTHELLETISRKYDHVIIDTPPILAFPDTLLWAKMSDAVILTTFAGNTVDADLREALERLRQMKVKVLGTILHSVRVHHSYNRYGYGYYENRTADKSSHKKTDKTMLLTMGEQDDGPANPES